MPELGVIAGVISADAQIEIDGEKNADLSAGLLSVLVEETTEGLYHCEARFGNWGSTQDGLGFLYLDREVLDFGKSLMVTLGAGDGNQQVFLGYISALEAQFTQDTPPSIVVLAEDRAQDLRMTRRTRVFEDMSDAETFEQIARDHNLTPDIDVPGPTHTILAQLNQSDLAFIRERARWLGAEVWLEDRTLRVQARTGRTPAGTNLTLIRGRGLMEFTATADLAHQHTSVVVSGWDALAKDAINAEANESALGSEINGDESGASILQSAFGNRVDRLARHVPLSSTEAQALADATFRAQARRFVSGVGIASGDGRIRVGTQLQLDDLGPLSGSYYVSEVRHLFTRQPGGGYTTEFVVERPGIGRAQ